MAPVPLSGQPFPDRGCGRCPPAFATAAPTPPRSKPSSATPPPKPPPVTSAPAPPTKQPSSAASSTSRSAEPSRPRTHATIRCTHRDRSAGARNPGPDPANMRDTPGPGDILTTPAKHAPARAGKRTDDAQRRGNGRFRHPVSGFSHRPGATRCTDLARSAFFPCQAGKLRFRAGRRAPWRVSAYRGRLPQSCPNGAYAVLTTPEASPDRMKAPGVLTRVRR